MLRSQNLGLRMRSKRFFRSDQASLALRVFYIMMRKNYFPKIISCEIISKEFCQTKSVWIDFMSVITHSFQILMLFFGPQQLSSHNCLRQRFQKAIFSRDRYLALSIVTLVGF